MSKLLLVPLSLSLLILSGCASGTFKERQEQREKMASSTGMYCQFVSGDRFPDLDVELSMEMGRRCDTNKNFTITNYKNSSDQAGVIYCCATLPMNEKKGPSFVSPAETKSSTEAVPTPEVNEKKK